MDGKLRLIDFDSTVEILPGGTEGTSYACAKFSSGVLPPEALHQLKEEERSQFDAYWAVLKNTDKSKYKDEDKDKDKDQELWKKVQPKVGVQGKQYVVRTFCTGDDGLPITPEGLPYKLLPASANFDMWSLGVMLYLLITGENLVPVTRDDDFASGTGMGFIFDWDDQKQRERLQLVNDACARDLLSQLLSREPTKRSNVQQLLNEHAFFNMKNGEVEILTAIQADIWKVREEQDKQTELLIKIDARTITIEGLQRETITKMGKHASNLRECIQAAVDDQVPTAFVILSHDPGTKPEQSVLDEVVAEIKETANTAGQLFKGESPSVNSLAIAGSNMLSLYHRGADAISTLKDAISDPRALAFKKLKEHAVNTLFLSLVCEACWMPQTGAYKITTQDDTCQKVMPIAKATLSTVKALNGIAGLAQCFFPLLCLLPSIPKGVMDTAQATIDELDVESSVAEFDEVQRVLKETDDREQGKQDGYCRRQFKQLLEKEDPGHEWAKLKRAILAEGKSIWICDCCTKVLEEPGNKDKSYEELRDLCKPQALKDFKVDEGAPKAVIGGGGGGGGGAGNEVGGKSVEVERPSSEATLELESLKSDNNHQKQLIDAQNQEQPLIDAQNEEQQSTVGQELTDQEASIDLAKLLQQHKNEIVSQMETKLETMMTKQQQKKPDCVML